MKKENKKLPSKEEIEEEVNKIFGKELPGITKEYVKGGHIWKIQSGNHTIRTNDAGKEMFEKALLEEGRKFWGK